ncbi:MAG: DUF4328 domain-containing protein [Ilumatobacteraceae bacterium]
MGGLSRAIVVLLGVFAVGTLIQLIATPGLVRSAQDRVAGEISNDQFMEDFNRFNVLGFLAVVSQLALVVLTIMWLFRLAKNHVALGRRLTWVPGWAIGGWFLPPIVYVIPTLMLRESWKAADPDVPPGDERWKSSPDSPLLWAWVALYVVAPVVFLLVGLRQQFDMMSREAVDIADAYDDRLGLRLAQGVVVLAAAAVWALFVRALTARHTTLTGEVPTR